MKLWSVYVVMMSTSLLAQDTMSHAPYGQQDPAAPAGTNTPAPTNESPAAAPAMAPAPAETPPAGTKPAKKKAPARRPRHLSGKASAAAASEMKTVPLVAGPAVVVATRVNVRGQAKLKSEIVSRLTNGEPVTVIEEVDLKRSGPEEPSAWAKILLPQSAHGWVNSSYIDPTNKTVLPKKLNLRAGPGENYSILGVLQRGDAVKEIEAKGNWLEIEPPTNAYAFVAAQYLSQETTVLAAAAPMEPAPVPEPAPAEAATNTPVPPPVTAETNTVMDTNQMAAMSTNEVPPAVPQVEEPPPPRIVQREGIVRYTASVQAPTMFELISPDNYRTIDFLYTTSTNLDLNRYKGLHIIVTGEEGLDERWRNTPIITIQRIQVIE